MVTRDNIGQMSLDKFVNEVSGIYSEQDKARPLWDIWLHANHHAAAIGEEARKYKPGGQLFKEIADFAMWLFTFVGKMYEIDKSGSSPFEIQERVIHTEKKLTFAEIIWNKYPGVCPVCFWRHAENSKKNVNIRCDCLIYEVETRDQSEERKHLDMLRKYANECSESIPTNVDDWQKMFRDIFEANLRHLDMKDIAFHLLEEVGEVSDAIIRMYTYKEKEFKKGEPYWRKTRLENELADVASWLFTLINHLEIIPEMTREFQKYAFGKALIPCDRILLSGIIWSRYGDDIRNSLYCPHECKATVCKCPIVLVNTEARLGELKSH